MNDGLSHGLTRPPLLFLLLDEVFRLFSTGLFSLRFAGAAAICSTIFSALDCSTLVAE